MFTLTHKLERYDVRGRKMLPKLVFTISSFRNLKAIAPYEEREFVYHWLAVDEPTEQQLKKIIEGELYQDVGDIYGAVAYAMTIGAIKCKPSNHQEKEYSAVN